LREVVSLVDLLPTLLGIADPTGIVSPVDPLDGRTLLPLLRGETAEGEGLAISEYTAEGVCAPARMVRRGRWKYVYTEGLPPMLFDLEDDPRELHDRAGEASLRAIEGMLHRRLLEGWDPQDIARRVADSQRRRLFLKAVCEAEDYPAWTWSTHAASTCAQAAASVPPMRRRWRAFRSCRPRRRTRSEPGLSVTATGEPGAGSQFGRCGSAGLPGPAIERWSSAMAVVLASPEIRDRMQAQGMDPWISCPAQFGALLNSDLALYALLLPRTSHPYPCRRCNTTPTTAANWRLNTHASVSGCDSWVADLMKRRRMTLRSWASVSWCSGLRCSSSVGRDSRKPNTLA
jgi:hypothetical protein